MRGIHFQNGTAAFRDDLPSPQRDGEVRVRVLKAGVCATDLALRRGYMGFEGVPGHEFVGVALEGALQGQRVVGEINAGCGNCESCKSEQSRHCPERTVLGILGRAGCFAEELSLPERNLLAVPDAVSDDTAVFTEPLAAALEIREQIALVSGMSALVIGDGRLGLLCAMVLDQEGLNVTLCGRHPEHQELLAPEIDHVTGLVEGNETPRFDLVVEATGNGAVLERAITFCKPRGVLVMKTTTETPASLDLSLAVVNEINLVGSRCGPFAAALNALAEKPIPTEAMIHGRYPLTDGLAALNHAAKSGVLKVLIEIGGDS